MSAWPVALLAGAPRVLRYPGGDSVPLSIKGSGSPDNVGNMHVRVIEPAS